MSMEEGRKIERERKRERENDSEKYHNKRKTKTYFQVYDSRWQIARRLQYKFDEQTRQA